MTPLGPALALHESGDALGEPDPASAGLGPAEVAARDEPVVAGLLGLDQPRIGSASSTPSSAATSAHAPEAEAEAE